MKYQIYAFANSDLNHCGVNDIDPIPTTMTGWVDACKTIEKKWRAWRRKYLKENPGDYPLRACNKRSTTYYLHPIGNPGEMAIFYINMKGGKSYDMSKMQSGN